MVISEISYKTLLKTIIPVILSVICLTGCQEHSYQYNEGMAFGTIYHITYESGNDWQPSIDSTLKAFSKELSMFDPQSTLSQFNRHNATPFSLAGHPWVSRVIRESIYYAQLTDGAFDITVAPLVNAWGFGYEKRASVSPVDIDSIRQFVGYRLIRLAGDTLIKEDPRLQLDASAIAKGYACDLIADLLKNKGIVNYLVEIGGEMALGGVNPQRKPWQIGINSPDDDSTSTHLTWIKKLQLTDRCLATSGNYRRFYLKNGRKLAHIIDPHTGYPVQHDLLSATVIAPDGLTADALATAFMVMGGQKALALAESLPDIEAVLICSDGPQKYRLISTSGIKKWMR
jgi:thiamine biosynthesis lipoprotein